MTIKLIGRIRFENEYIEDLVYTLEMTEERAKQVRDLSKKVVELNAYELCYFDYAIDAYTTDCVYDQDDADSITLKEKDLESLDCVILHIGDAYIRYTGYLKHCSDLFTTGWIDLSELQESDKFVYVE